MLHLLYHLAEVPMASQYPRLPRLRLLRLPHLQKLRHDAIS